MPQSSFTILSNMMGASLLSGAYIIQRLGWVLGALAFIFTIAYNYFFFYFYVECIHYTQAHSVREATEKVISKKLSLVLDVGLMISYFGFMVAYIIISATAVIQFVQNVIHYTLDSYAVKAVISVCLIFPLCLLKSLKQLSKVASIAGLFIFITGLTIIVYFFIHVKSGVICETDDGPIRYSLPTWPKASAGKSFLYFLMYLPALQGYFSAHTVLPTLNMEL